MHYLIIFVMAHKNNFMSDLSDFFKMLEEFSLIPHLS